MDDTDIDPIATVTPECEVIFEGEEDKLESMFKDCSKNPGHENFIPVSEFRMEHLPERRRTQEFSDFIKARSNSTVRLVVRFTSLERPFKFADINAPYPYTRFKGSSRKVRYGTGSIIYITPEAEPMKGESCPCHECQKSDHEPVREFWKAIVRTATHVVYDDSEAVRTTVDCFYDSDENSEEVVKHLYGHRVLTYKQKSAMDTYLSDMCHLECFTHDRQLVQKLEPWIGLIQNDFAQPDHEHSLGVMISHPHGCSKRITLGSVWHLTYPRIENYPDLEVTKCRLPLFPWSKYRDGPEGVNPVPSFENTSTSKEGSESGDSSSKDSAPVTDPDTNLFTPPPGTEFDLPDDMVIAFPDNPDYALRYTYHQPNWFTLPPGTKFTLGNGQSVFFPPEAEFFDDGCVSGCCYVTYDTDTCPGSSGACMIQDIGRHQFRINFPHMGSKGKTENRSGLHYYDLLKRL